MPSLSVARCYYGSDPDAGKEKGMRMRTLDLGLDIVDRVGRLHLKGDRLPRESLDENLHDGLGGVWMSVI